MHPYAELTKTVMTDHSTTPSWQLPPEPINQILNTPPTPTLAVSPNYKWVVELEKPLLLDIAELAEPEVALAGCLINPQTNGPSGQNAYRSIKIREFSGDTFQVIPLPDGARISFLKWSPDGEKLAFTMTQPTGLELWVLDMMTRKPQQLTEPVLSAAYGTIYQWLSNQALVYKVISPGRTAPVESPVPNGPLIQENLGCKKAHRTYTNLLKNPYDEALFEYYLMADLEIVSLDGRRQQLLSASLIDEVVPSPDGNYILVTTLHRPFSYQLPVPRFGMRIEVINLAGGVVYRVADLPLDDQRSTQFDAVRPGRRRVSWRSDRAATLYWVEALDNGDPKLEVPHRDALWQLDAPFTTSPSLLWQSQYRFRHIRWGREDVAIASEQNYNTRHTRLWRINPQAPATPPQLLIERSSEDKYTDPGSLLMKPTDWGWYVLRFTPNGQGVYFSGRGASPRGVYPFLDRMELQTGAKTRLWQCQDPYFEEVCDVLDDAAHSFITQRQSQTEPANYFLYRGQAEPIQLSDYTDPVPQLAGIQKELVQYERHDGVQLSATLYLPSGYDASCDGPLPMMFWVYPEEFKDREFAGQITTPTNTFSRPSRKHASILFLLTQGYAVLSNPSLPIIGEGDVEPNDTYVEQLIAGAKAAVQYVVDRGVADPKKIGIGGHSYGAFTTVNLLAHTDLFRLGIARSGAYNRTLTPFGFQGEQRNFWEAAETYIHMSPFTHAEKVKAPLLLIHGGSDSNPGTYPVQSERLYEALTGLGATVRWVVLPLEDHGYCSRQGVGHVLWEMVNWCDRYLK